MRIKISSYRGIPAMAWHHSIGAMVALLLLVAYTAKPYIDEPLDVWSPADEHRNRQTTQGGRDNETLVLLAFSGGGTRAAAFADGVLQELAATEIVTASIG